MSVQPKIPLRRAGKVHTSKSILVLHGPNLNLLGVRERGIYGSETLSLINRRLKEKADQVGATLEAMQSNSEGDLVDRVQGCLRKPVDFIIINPAAYTHTSVALRDALTAVKVPFIEVHLSNIHAREPFRRHSYFSDLARGVICGFGPAGYEMALDFALNAEVA